MKITIENTTRIVHIEGVPARIWEGQTESGIPVLCFVTRIAVPNGMPCEQFELELAQQRVPSVEATAIPARLIL